MTFRIAGGAIIAATALITASPALAGWDGFIKSNISQFGEPVRFEMEFDSNGYRLKDKTYNVPIEYRAEVSGAGRKLKAIDVNVQTTLHGPGRYAGVRRQLDQKAAWGKTVLPLRLAHLAPMAAAGKAACAKHGGASVKNVEVKLPLQMRVTFADGRKTREFTKDANVPAVFVCAAQPSRKTVDLQLEKLKVYTLPVKPACGEPVRMVAEFWTNKPGTVSFQYVRGDGEKQNASVTTEKVNGGYAKRWGKTYTFSQSESRKYMVVVNGHKASSNWVPIDVNCG